MVSCHFRWGFHAATWREPFCFIGSTSEGLMNIPSGGDHDQYSLYLGLCHENVNGYFLKFLYETMLVLLVTI